MGSAKVSNATQSTMAETEKKSIKKLLRELFKIDKKKEKIAQPANVEPDKTTSTQVVENILEKIKKLDIKEQAHESEDEDEFKNFTFKTVSVDNLRADRSQSHSSEDSGFAEKYVPDLEEGKEKEKDDEIAIPFEKLNLKDGKKEKRLQTVVIARGPIRHKGDSNRQTGPYSVQTDTCRQIQINKHTLTGGQVIVNPRNVDFLEFDNALKQVQQTSEQSHHEYGGEWLNIVSEYIREDSLKNSNEGNNMLSEFLQSEELQSNCENIILTPPHQAPEISQPNPIEEFTNHIQNELFGDVSDLTILNELADIPDNQNQYFLTPPHSVNAYSPMSDSASYKNSDYTYSPGRSSILSPERSSPICSGDYEKFQEISPYEDTSGACKKSVERKDSGSSMTLKQYKDLQREITHSFSKKDCCLLERTTCKQIFLEYLQRLSQEQRKNMCLKVAKLDLNNAYGVLQNILISLSQSNEMEDLQCALFRLVCERVLAQKPDWFVDDFGLNLLKSAALRCHHRPELTRCLVHCVRNAIKHDSALVQGRESVFHEVDALGDTLLIACVRRGDACANVLAELTRRDVGVEQIPLFRVNHFNADGASALHVACSEHSAATPRLHCAHILLEHAGADLWLGDAKGGDTALHMAVNSRTCDLTLIMVIFSHLNRKEWKKLAHAPNTCSKSPLENARSAMRSPSRENYPPEVLEFLKKCR